MRVDSRLPGSFAGVTVDEKSERSTPATYPFRTNLAAHPPLSVIQDGIVRGACPHDCPDTCAMWVHVEGGRATKVQGDPEHPVTQGFLCTKVNRYVERTYHPDRLLTPMRRVGAK